MLFAHVAPQKGLAHEHGSQELFKDLQKLGYHEVICKWDGESLLRSVQDEVKKRNPREPRQPGQRGS